MPNTTEEAVQPAATEIPTDPDLGFVAINYISCKDFYREKFEYLFRTRAKAIDRMPGFRFMRVLRPQRDGAPYLIMSFWDSEDCFKAWVGSPEFIEGHKRGFEDVKLAKERGEEPPITSDFITYSVVTD